MTRRTRRLLALLTWPVLTFYASVSFADAIHYGDFGPDLPSGVLIFEDVRETSGTDPAPPARFGAPTLAADALDFEPVWVVASATSGGSATTLGELRFGVSVRQEPNGEFPGGVGALLVSDYGDLTLVGDDTGSTSVTDSLSMRVDILEVDGAPITPLSVAESSAIERDLMADGAVILAPWENGVLIEFAPLLVENDIEFTFGVTRAEVVVNHQLLAASGPGSVAFIAMKDFVIESGLVPGPDPLVPEPASAALLLAVVACVSRTRMAPRRSTRAAIKEREA